MELFALLSKKYCLINMSVFFYRSAVFNILIIIALTAALAGKVQLYTNSSFLIWGSDKDGYLGAVHKCRHFLLWPPPYPLLWKWNVGLQHIGLVSFLHHYSNMSVFLVKLLLYFSYLHVMIIFKLIEFTMQLLRFRWNIRLQFCFELSNFGFNVRHQFCFHLWLQFSFTKASLNDSLLIKVMIFIHIFQPPSPLKVNLIISENVYIYELPLSETIIYWFDLIYWWLRTNWK